MQIYQPHPAQCKILESKKRFKVIVCGRRFGKTLGAIGELLYQALTTSGGRFFYVSPTYRQSHMIASRTLFDAYLALPKEFQVKKNESSLSIEIKNPNLAHSSLIELKGADDEDSLRGVRLNGCILDEYAYMKPNVFQKIIRPSLTDTEGWCWFIGSPAGMNHFYELYNFAQKEENKEDWDAFKFTTYDNPFINPKEIDKARLELSEDYFAQEYLAEFKKFTGLIYKDFNRDLSVIDPIDVSLFQKYRSIDFGAVHPFVCLWIAVDGDDNWYVYREHCKAGETTKFHATLINNNSLGEEYVATYQDPSAHQLQLDLAEFGIYTIPAINTVNPKDVGTGISKIQERFKVNPITGKPRIFIFKDCINLIKELETYHWDEKRGSTELKSKPFKEMDDACLVGETKILMNNNKQKEIKDIRVGDIVKTQNGFQKVADWCLTRENADVLEVELSNGYKIKGTKNHRIYTLKGKTRIDALRYGDKIIVDNDCSTIWKIILNLMVGVTTGTGSITKGLEVVKKDVVRCIKRFGLQIMGIFQKDLIFTTEIGTEQTISWKTLNWLKRENITQNIQKRIFRRIKSGCSNIWQKLERKQKNGMLQGRDWLGTKNMGLFVGIEEKSDVEIVKFAGKNFVQRTIGKNFAEIIASLHLDVKAVKIWLNGFALGVKKFVKRISIVKQKVVPWVVRVAPCGKQNVYNITVANEHNYYANGILVANCDSLRYFSNTYIAVKGKSSFEEWKDSIGRDKSNRFTGY